MEESVRTPKRTPNPRSLKNLRAPWKPGESGNPGGCPRRALTEAYEAQLRRVKKGDKQKRTFAELIADAHIRKAMKGNTMAAKEVADRVEGKSRERLDVAVEVPLEFNVTVNFVDTDGSIRGMDLGELAE